jgi:hypothetical protein
MFDASVYVARRERLARDVGTGLVLLLGNAEAPMNYRDNQYPFRQDSTFLYYFGLDRPDLAAVVDCDAGAVHGLRRRLHGGRHRLARPAADACRAGGRRRGVGHRSRARRSPTSSAEARRQAARVHFLPPYRAENALWLERLTGRPASGRRGPASLRPHPGRRRATVGQVGRGARRDRRRARDHARHALLAMRLSRPGVFEREVAGAMEGVALSRGGRLAFPTIFTVRGETLHNHFHGHRMEAGQLVNDCGAESALHYAADTTRTIPVGGGLTGARRDLYEAVLRAQLRAIDAIRPGVLYRDVHLAAARSLAADLVELGCLRGDVEAAVAAGAHALFFPHGLGHMLGLDVHDMEHLGEDHVGYDATIRRSEQFGLKALRFARQLEPGFVVTVEPGLYFIPRLIDQWRAEGRRRLHRLRRGRSVPWRGRPPHRGRRRRDVRRGLPRARTADPEAPRGRGGGRLGLSARGRVRTALPCRLRRASGTLGRFKNSTNELNFRACRSSILCCSRRSGSGASRSAIASS